MIFLLDQFRGDPVTALQIFAAILVAALAGMTIHEFAHNYVGHLMGDPNPARQGRLTLDPTVHINWVGFAMFVLLGFGVLGSAPISPTRMRNPRWGYFAAVAAGPLSNLLLATVFALIFRLALALGLDISDLLFRFVIIAIQFNVLLFLFNLLPLYPIDGWWLVYSLLPPDMAYWWERNRQNTQYVFMALLFLSFVPGLPSFFGLFIDPPMAFIMNLLLGFG